jgi:transcriptional regulator with XRE-family HTH domain
MAHHGDRRRACTLTLNKKLLILQLLDKGHTQCSIARRFHTTQSTISKIFTDRKNILKSTKKADDKVCKSDNEEYDNESGEEEEVNIEHDSDGDDDHDDNVDDDGDDDDDDADDADDNTYKEDEDDYVCGKNNERRGRKLRTTSSLDNKFVKSIGRYLNDILDGKFKLDDYQLMQLRQQKDSVYQLACDSTSLMTKSAILQDSRVLTALIHPLLEFYENINTEPRQYLAGC